MDGVNWTEVAPLWRIEGVGPVTMATEEQGKVGEAWLGVVVAGRGYQLKAIMRMCYRMIGNQPNALRTVGRTAINRKPTTTAWPCAPQWMAPV